MQLLRDPSVEPEAAVIADGLGAANALYLQFLEGLKARDIAVEWRYYNDGKSWLGKGMYKAKNTFWLSIWEGYFQLSIFIPERLRAEALELPLDAKVKEMITASRQMGKLKFFPLVFEVKSENQLDPIYTLIDFRKTIK